MKKIGAVLVLLVTTGIFFFLYTKNQQSTKPPLQTNMREEDTVYQGDLPNLSIEILRRTKTPGGDLVIEETLGPGSNYNRYVVSYQSEGNTIYALLTVPHDTSRKHPVILFNHGYVSPREYRTTERYINYVDSFARNGYIVFLSDYRGHGNSEGQAAGGYSSNAYTIDVLNALASVKRYKAADPARIGMWGHSMGGFITLRSMVVNKDIKAGVIWAGVVAPYEDIIYSWRRSSSTPSLPSGARRWRDQLLATYGTPEENPPFWHSISANNFLTAISGPIQIHHGTADSSVPIAFSEKLNQQLKDAKKVVEYYSYEGDDHNISQNFSTAMQRSIDFFDRYVKGGERNE